MAGFRDYALERTFPVFWNPIMSQWFTFRKNPERDIFANWTHLFPGHI